MSHLQYMWVAPFVTQVGFTPTSMWITPFFLIFNIFNNIIIILLNYLNLMNILHQISSLSEDK